MAVQKLQITHPGDLRARRLNLKLPNSTIGVSVPAGATDAQIARDVLRMMEAYERGKCRTIVSLDGWRTPLYPLLVASSYIHSWVLQALLATVFRQRTERRIASLRETILAQVD